MNQLDSLKRFSTVVADTSDFERIREFTPQDATTNPSLILKATQDPRYQPLIDRSQAAAQRVAGDTARRTEAFLDELSVTFGTAILDIVPGRVSTEVDARLSFDTDGTVAKARSLIGRYEERGVDRQRVLIKVASTWEGILAARQLEEDGIRTNLTLLFSFAQAVACAEAGVTLVSPFVGRIYDYWRQARGVDDIPLDDDPGVASVTRIYEYYKKFGHQTEVMGASFRKADQVVRLAGCDLLTISPELLAELASRPEPISAPALTPGRAAASDHERISLDEKTFRWLHNGDEMAVAKLAEGIRRFDADARKLERYARERVETAS